MRYFNPLFTLVSRRFQLDDNNPGWRHIFGHLNERGDGTDFILFSICRKIRKYVCGVCRHEPHKGIIIHESEFPFSTHGCHRDDFIIKIYISRFFPIRSISRSLKTSVWLKLGQRVVSRITLSFLKVDY